MAGALNLQNRNGVNATGNRTGNQPVGDTPPRTDYGAGANPNVPGAPPPQTHPAGGAIGQRAQNYRQVNQGF